MTTLVSRSQYTPCCTRETRPRDPRPRLFDRPRDRPSAWPSGGAGGPPRWPSPESTALDPAGGAWASGAVFGDGGSAVGLKAGARTLERTFTLRSRATSAAAAGGMSAFHSSGALR